MFITLVLTSLVYHLSTCLFSLSDILFQAYNFDDVVVFSYVLISIFFEGFVYDPFPLSPGAAGLRLPRGAFRPQLAAPECRRGKPWGQHVIERRLSVWLRWVLPMPFLRPSVLPKEHQWRSLPKVRWCRTWLHPQPPKQPATQDSSPAGRDEKSQTCGFKGRQGMHS